MEEQNKDALPVEKKLEGYYYCDDPSVSENRKVKDFFIGFFIGFLFPFAWGIINLIDSLSFPDSFISNEVERVISVLGLIICVLLLVYFFKINRMYIALGMLTIFLLPTLFYGACIMIFFL